MGNRGLIDNYYKDYYNLIDLLCKLVNDYKLLVGSTCELNQLALAHKQDIKKSLKRVRKIGNMIDEILDIIEETEMNYFEYCKIKAIIVKEKIEIEYVKSEIQTLMDYDLGKKKV